MIVKGLLLLVGICGVVSGSHLYSIIGESYHAPQPYKFGYHVKDKDSTQHRHEEGDGHGNVRGTYGYTDDKGQYREVHYVADKNGFRAEVKTNEAGTANQNPAHVEVKANPPHHHLTHHDSHHHVPQLHVSHHHIPVHHHIPQHHEIKIEHHVPTHHKWEAEPLHKHHDFGNHHHHHDHNSFQHFSSPFSSYKFDSFAPLHGYSYNPSAFHHGHDHWPFAHSNSYGSWKSDKGFGYSSPLHTHHHGFGGLSNFNTDIDGLSSSHKEKYEKIMEEIKAKSHKHHEPLGHFSGLKEHGFSSLDSDDKGWKYGFGNF